LCTLVKAPTNSLGLGIAVTAPGIHGPLLPIVRSSPEKGNPKNTVALPNSAKTNNLPNRPIGKYPENE
jgi:hypothetical protein